MQTLTSIALSKPSLADLIAHGNALADTAERAGVTGETLDAMYAMRHAADFLEHASELISVGRALPTRRLRNGSDGR